MSKLHNDVVDSQALLFGLSKERPILGDHAKAHILDFHEIRRISREIWQIS